MRGLFAVALVLGCSEAPPVPEASSSSAEAPHVDEADLLASLGYLASEEVASETGVVLHDSSAAHPGLNLYVTQHGQEALLLDMEGEVVHRWVGSPAETEGGPTPFGPWWRTVHLLPDGALLAQTDYGSLARLDRDSNVEWVFGGRTHHDFAVDGRGHIFVLVGRAAATPHLEGHVLQDFLVELDPEGRELRRVSILEALVAGEQHEVLAALREVQATRPESRQDPIHTNTVELLDGRLADRIEAFRAGNVLLSLPLVAALVVIDLDARKIVWSLAGSFRHQHDPSVLPSGRLLLFDNKGLGERSRILEIDPVTGDETVVYGASDAQRFYSECCGRAYRLPNRNTLVIDAKVARAFEIAPDGRTVWEFRSPHTVDGKVAVLHDLLRIPVPGWLHAN